ncbi:flagellar protein FlaG [Jeotgalibacillus aurantiacus]|uniref:flagellar protein FlaG n=1 Tax=Jeotgalibacillus aurantiacus TaxID=2763266 RepID=UPI001D0BC10E|nr:flagellar protein FlaG [Jeotgalibacillus aurantiacus]
MNRIGESVNKVANVGQPLQSKKITDHTAQVSIGVAEQTVKPTKEQMEKAVKGINDFLRPTSAHLKFEFHEDLEEYYVTIVDEVSKEVIKEIPSKKLLDSYAAMTDFLGMLMDQKV